MTAGQRHWLVALAAFVAFAFGWSTARSGESSPPATGDWRVTVPDPDALRAIEGYASSSSVAPGEKLELHVSTTPTARYRVELYRIGWYGGAGGALVGCLPEGCAETSVGSAREVPTPNPETGEIRAAWPATDRLVVPADWRSGEYLAKLVLVDGPSAGRSASVPFVVREPADAAAAILVVVPVNTWQTYNDWGGLSAYSDPRPAVRVSFDRPYAPGLVKPTLGYPVVRFLDRYRYDVAFTTDVDIDRHRAELVQHRVIVVTGHSEYWTKEERDGLEAARGLGVDLVFLGGNTSYWQVRYADAERRVLEIYRDGGRDPSSNPRQKTVRWRDAPLDRPECELLGVQWQGGDESTDPDHHSYTVTAAGARHPWLRATGLRGGDRVTGAVGKEWDSVAPECPELGPRLTTLFHYEGKQTPQPVGVWKSTFHSTDADAVTYTAPSGAVVFSAGSIDFGWLLAGVPEKGDPSPGTTDPATPPDARIERFVRTMLDDLARE